MANAPKRTTILRASEMPEQYCIRAEGGCMEPVFFSGDPLLIDAMAAPALGDFVAIWRRRELVRTGEHQIIVKRLVRFGKVNGAECAILEMLNPRAIIAMPVMGIEAMHKCMGTLPANRTPVKLTDEEILAARSAA